MNIYQRIALIVGSFMLAIVLLTTPRYVKLGGKRLSVTNYSTRNYHFRYDFKAALIRGCAVAGLTFSAYIVLKSKDYIN